MKRISLSILSICLVLSFISCDKSDPSQGTPDSSGGTQMNQASPGDAPAQPQTVSANHGFVIRTGSGFYSINPKDGKDVAKYEEAVSLGEKVEIRNGGQIRKAFYNNDELDFVEVRRDTGKTGYIINYQVARGGRLAVVLNDEVYVYKTPKNQDVTSFILDPKTVVVIYPESDQGGFIKFSTYDPKAKRYFNDQYIKSNLASIRDTDIQSSILLQLAQAETQPIRKEALLKSALSDYPDSIFYQEINNIVNPPTKADQFSSAGTLYINDNKVSIRASADEINGTTVGQLAKGTAVQIDRETIDSYSVDGAYAKWYHITSPVSGWVYGVYLDSLPPSGE